MIKMGQGTVTDLRVKGNWIDFKLVEANGVYTSCEAHLGDFNDTNTPQEGDWVSVAGGEEKLKKYISKVDGLEKQYIIFHLRPKDIKIVLHHVPTATAVEAEKEEEVKLPF